MQQDFISLLEDTETRDNLTIIDFSESYQTILAQDKKTGKAHYIYSAFFDVSFDFSLLSEVGQTWVKSFKKLLSDNNLKPVKTETETDYFEVLKPKH